MTAAGEHGDPGLGPYKSERHSGSIAGNATETQSSGKPLKTAQRPGLALQSIFDALSGDQAMRWSVVAAWSIGMLFRFFAADSLFGGLAALAVAANYCIVMATSWSAAARGGCGVELAPAAQGSGAPSPRPARLPSRHRSSNRLSIRAWGMHRLWCTCDRYLEWRFW